MSQYKKISTQFRSLDSLKKALKDVGFGHFDLSANVKANSLTLAGYAGRQGENVALRLPKSHYHGFEDTGFAWDDETKTYRAIISTHDGNGNFGEGTLNKVKQHYAYFELTRQARQKGYSVRRQKGEDGVIRLKLKKY
jgi:hypothetical protein